MADDRIPLALQDLVVLYVEEDHSFNHVFFYVLDADDARIGPSLSIDLAARKWTYHHATYPIGVSNVDARGSLMNVSRHGEVLGVYHRRSAGDLGMMAREVAHIQSSILRNVLSPLRPNPGTVAAF